MPPNNPFDIDNEEEYCKDGYYIFTLANINEYLKSQKRLDIKCNGINYVGTITGTSPDLPSIPKTITVKTEEDKGTQELIVTECCFKPVVEYDDHNRWFVGGKQKTKRKQYKKSKSKKSKKNKKKTTRKNKCGKRFPKN